MRIPVILMLLTVLLLPADLRGLADQVQTGTQTAQAMVIKFLKRDDAVRVAETSTRPGLGGTATQVQ